MQTIHQIHLSTNDLCCFRVHIWLTLEGSNGINIKIYNFIVYFFHVVQWQQMYQHTIITILSLSSLPYTPVMLSIWPTISHLTYFEGLANESIHSTLNIHFVSLLLVLTTHAQNLHFRNINHIHFSIHVATCK